MLIAQVAAGHRMTLKTKNMLKSTVKSLCNAAFCS